MPSSLCALTHRNTSSQVAFQRAFNCFCCLTGTLTQWSYHEWCLFYRCRVYHQFRSCWWSQATTYPQQPVPHKSKAVSYLAPKRQYWLLSSGATPALGRFLRHCSLNGLNFGRHSWRPWIGKYALWSALCTQSSGLWVCCLLEGISWVLAPSVSRYG